MKCYEMHVITYLGVQNAGDRQSLWEDCEYVSKHKKYLNVHVCMLHAHVLNKRKEDIGRIYQTNNVKVGCTLANRYLKVP